MLRKISSVGEYNKCVRIKDHEFWVKHATTPDELLDGLMHVKTLDSKNGCLLDFGNEQSFGLWMKNCSVNLDALVLNAKGEVTDILHMLYSDPNRIHHSQGKYALELDPFAVSSLDIKVGDKVELNAQTNQTNQ